MDYSKFTKTILAKVLAAMALINNPEIAPEVRQLNQEILLREVGAAVLAKIYDMNAYDFEIQHTKGLGSDDRYYGLAKAASASIAVGGAATVAAQVKNYLHQMGALAQEHATVAARQNGKRPTVTRKLNGEKNCKWCRDKQVENATDPPASTFHRHAGCDCIIITKGYKSRNGLLKNYKPRVEQ